MIRGRILIIDGDEWIGSLLGREFRDKGFESDVCDGAVEGYKKACSTVPDCIVCSIVLPDIDGFWLVRRVRTEPGVIAKTPVLLVGDAADRNARIQGLNVGADVVVERPITNDVLVAQADALIAMARRLRPSRESVEDMPKPSLPAAFRGDLSSFQLASILMMLEMERRTGTLEVVAGDGRRSVLVLSMGNFATTEVGGSPRPPIDALREVLSWRAGRFAFRPRDVGSIPPPGGPVGALVLEAMRLDDEQKHIDAQAPRSGCEF